MGDEDLLEIIGNSKNIARLQKHFKKMFAPITPILLNVEQNLITGIASKEGEEVKFVTPVSTVDFPRSASAPPTLFLSRPSRQDQQVAVPAGAPDAGVPGHRRGQGCGGRQGDG